MVFSMCSDLDVTRVFPVVRQRLHYASWITRLDDSVEERRIAR